MTGTSDPPLERRGFRSGVVRFMARRVPATMLGRQIVVLFSCLLLVQVSFVWIVLSSRSLPVAREQLQRETSYVVGMIRALDALPANRRAGVTTSGPPLPFDVRWWPAATPYRAVRLDDPSARSPLGHAVVEQLGPDYQLVRLQGAIGDDRAFVRLPDGSFVEFNGTPPPLPLPLPIPWLPLGNMFLLLLALVTGGIIVTRQVTRPLSRLVAAADTIGTNPSAPAVVEEGPIETRQLARALNAMRDRLRLYLESRTEMLAAMSHDLGTPLTRMRLRAELVGDPVLRQRFVDDLTEMDELLQSTLGLLRGQMEGADTGTIDVESLLKEVQSELAEVGGKACLQVRPLRPIRGHRLLLKRAISNVVHNAVKFSGAAEIAAESCANEIRIVVSDRGPGIPDADLPRIFQPFYRVDASRNRHSGGTGLGLAIAFDAVRRHRGSIEARNRSGGGLEVELRLPID